MPCYPRVHTKKRLDFVIWEINRKILGNFRKVRHTHSLCCSAANSVINSLVRGSISPFSSSTNQIKQYDSFRLSYLVTPMFPLTPALSTTS